MGFKGNLTRISRKRKSHWPIVSMESLLPEGVDGNADTHSKKTRTASAQTVSFRTEKTEFERMKVLVVGGGLTGGMISYFLKGVKQFKITCWEKVVD